MSGTYWYSWHKNSAASSGNMWGVRYGNRHFVGHVTMVFSHRRSDAIWTSTGKTASYFENVRLSGMLPGNGGSVQYWHWSWHAHNWLPNQH
jgi:hypothetical protein